MDFCHTAYDEYVQECKNAGMSEPFIKVTSEPRIRTDEDEEEGNDREGLIIEIGDDATSDEEEKMEETSRDERSAVTDVARASTKISTPSKSTD